MRAQSCQTARMDLSWQTARMDLVPRRTFRKSIVTCAVKVLSGLCARCTMVQLQRICHICHLSCVVV